MYTDIHKYINMYINIINVHAYTPRWPRLPSSPSAAHDIHELLATAPALAQPPRSATQPLLAEHLDNEGHDSFIRVTWLILNRTVATQPSTAEYVWCVWQRRERGVFVNSWDEVCVLNFNVNQLMKAKLKMHSCVLVRHDWVTHSDLYLNAK